MSFFLLTLAASLFSPAAQADLSCKAIYRSLDEKNDTIEKSEAIPLVRTFDRSAKHELDFEGKFFAITEDRSNGDLFAQITTAPDYTKGTVVRGAADSQGRFTATEVVGFTVYRMECTRR